VLSTHCGLCPFLLLHKNLLVVDAVCLVKHAVETGLKFGEKNKNFYKKI